MTDIAPLFIETAEHPYGWEDVGTSMTKLSRKFTGRKLEKENNSECPNLKYIKTKGPSGPFVWWNFHELR